MTTLHCPGCGSPALYIRQLDRYVHSDGTLNDDCWVACTRGDINQLIARRNDQQLACRRRNAA